MVSLADILEISLPTILPYCSVTGPLDVGGGVVFSLKHRSSGVEVAVAYSHKDESSLITATQKIDFAAHLVRSAQETLDVVTDTNAEEPRS